MLTAASGGLPARLEALAAELRDLYPDFAPYAERCKYGASCTHDHEPDCAVFEAVEAGQVPPTRYASYVEVLDEIAPPPDDDLIADPEAEAT